MLNKKMKCENWDMIIEDDWDVQSISFGHDNHTVGIIVKQTENQTAKSVHLSITTPHW